MYDIKYLMKFCENLHGGLNKLAEVLDVDRIGPQHQARPKKEYLQTHIHKCVLLLSGCPCAIGVGLGWPHSRRLPAVTKGVLLKLLRTGARLRL